MPQTYGFKQTRERRIPELGAVLHEYTHAKSGARLCWLERADENKSFCAAFRTLPYDDSGVFHILEHSVLCGSEQFPVKEPFVELMKGSLNTFLNALTYPDKTCYPVSSRNDQDFLNLMHVYLDAVFFPRIHEKPEIFQQEGWHYELQDGVLTRSGVVLNEMKGSFADPDTLLANARCSRIRRTVSSPAATRRPSRPSPTKPLPPRTSGFIIRPTPTSCSTAASI